MTEDLTPEEIGAYIDYRSGDHSPETEAQAKQCVEKADALRQRVEAWQVYEKTNARIEKIMKMAVPVDDTYEERKETVLLYRSRLCSMASRLEKIHREYPGDKDLARVRCYVAVCVSKSQYVSSDASMQYWDYTLDDAEQLLKKYE